MTIVTHLIAYLKRLHYGTCIDPTRDWLVLITLSAVAFASIVVWNAWTFNTAASGGVIGTAATSTPSIFNQSSIDAITTVFTKRAAEEKKYESGVYHFADPSQ